MTSLTTLPNLSLWQEGSLLFTSCIREETLWGDLEWLLVVPNIVGLNEHPESTAGILLGHTVTILEDEDTNLRVRGTSPRMQMFETAQKIDQELKLGKRIFCFISIPDMEAVREQPRNWGEHAFDLTFYSTAHELTPETPSSELYDVIDSGAAQPLGQTISCEPILPVAR